MRRGVALAALVLALAAGCTPNGPGVSHSSPAANKSASPSPTPSPSPSAAPTPSPSASPSAVPTPASVPSWAALHTTCTGAPTADEAVLRVLGQSGLEIADVTNAADPKPLCTITGNSNLTPQLVSQTMISWYAAENPAGTPGPAVIAVLDLSTGASAVVASWQGGGYFDGLHAWSPDRGFLAYATSDAAGFNLHLLSGGGDRVVASMGAVPARGANPNEDDAYLAFSPDGAYFALVQTFTSSGDQLQVRRTQDGSIAYSLPTGTMATWASTGSRLYFRQPGSGAIEVWNSSGGVQQAFGQAMAWIRPRADAGPDELAFTVRDSSGKPHAWLYGNGGRSGGELPNVRSSPAWLNSGAFFYVEEVQCATNCPLGPTWQPDGKTFTFDVATQTETASRIATVYSAWPRPGQA